jgi:hypothetical protein
MVHAAGLCNIFYLLLIDLVELGKQFRVLWNSLVVLSGKSNRPLFVDDEDCALGHSLRPQTMILSAHCAMRPEIRQHREVDATHSFGKYFVRKNRIDTYAQNLGVSGFEFLAVFFEAA